MNKTSSLKILEKLIMSQSKNYMKVFRIMVLCLIINMKTSSNNPDLTKKIGNRILGKVPTRYVYL